MIRSYSRKVGFTLVEMLVVVAIIATMIGITLAAIQQSRSNADDRFMQEQLGVMRLDAEFSYKQNSREYDQVCTDVQVDFSGLNSSDKTCLDGLDGYAISVQVSDGTYYCVDSGRTRPQADLATSTIASSGNCQSGSAVDCTCGP